MRGAMPGSILSSARLAALVALASLPLAAAPAFAACVPDGAGISSGATVTCTGTDTTGVGDGTQNNVTVTVQPGAAITLGDNATAINLGSGNIVINNGAITVGNASAASGQAIAIMMDTSSIINNGAIAAGSASGANSQVAGMLTGNGITIQNGGTMTLGSATGLLSQVFGISVNNGNVVTNSGTLTLGDATGANSVVTGMRALGVNNTLTNLGAVTLGDAAGASSIIFGIVAPGLNNDTVVNSGAVRLGNASGAGSTISALAGNTHATIINGGAVTAGSATGAGSEIDGISARLASTITNSGAVTLGDATGAGSQVIGIKASAGDTVTNSGTVAVGANGFSIMGGTVTNTGTLDGMINAGVLTNAGLITITNGGTPLGPDYTIGGTFTQSAGGTLALRVNAAGANDTVAVGGTANLGGTLGAAVQPGLYADTTKYLGVVTAANPITTQFTQTRPFAAGTTTPLAFFTLTPTYNANSVDLTLTRLGFGSVAGESANQQAVGNALEAVYSPALTGSAATALSNLLQATSVQALTQADGEDATGAAHGAFQLMSQFLDLLLDPSSGGGGGVGAGAGASGGALGFAPERPADFSPAVARAYAGLLKAPPAAAAPRWTAWGTAFGGSGLTDGNAAIGSNSVTVATYGFAAGADFRADAATRYGFALAGAGTNWGLAQGLGSGRSDAVMAGVYGKHALGAAYVSAALAFADNWFTTNRTAPGGDQLTANFAGQSLGARLEGGYRLPVSTGHASVGITPYAALQTQWFHTPTYGETDPTGSGFALSYAAMTANDTRGELGARLDALTMLDGRPLILRARLAWAHDRVSNPALDAVFQVLPGASFVVNGAPPPADQALASAGAEWHLTPHWSALARFDGAFAATAQTYAGSATLRYAW